MNDAWLVTSVHEANLLALIKGKNFKTSLDIGAHCGLWTLALADVSDLVISFEPNPEAYAELRKNIEGLRNVLLEKKAVTYYCGTGMLNMWETTSHSTLCPEGHPLHTLVDNDHRDMKVDTVSLDGYLVDS